jgi:uncharacterized protein (TIGR02001 family)
MTNIWTRAAVTLALWPAAAAADDFSGQAAVVSDYVLRGVSYSDGHAAVQGSLTWSNAGGVTGLHADGWVSSIDFGRGDPAKAELWGTVGYTASAGPLTIDTGLEYTHYAGAPKALHYAYYDGFVSATAALGVVSATAAVRHAPDYSGATGPATFVDLTAATPFLALFTTDVSVGRATLRPAAGGTYMYWSAGVGAAWKGLTAAVRYHGSDLGACALPCGHRVVFSVGAGF